MPGAGITQVKLNSKCEEFFPLALSTAGIFVILGIFCDKYRASFTGKLPSLEEIQEGLGTWAIVLYSTASATTLILLLQFAILIRSLWCFSTINQHTHKIFDCQAVRHVRRGGPVEEHHLGQFRLCCTLRFQPCKSCRWIFRPISRYYFRPIINNPPQQL